MKYKHLNEEKLNMVKGVLSGEIEFLKLLDLMSDNEYEEAVVYIANYITINQGKSCDEKWMQLYNKVINKLSEKHTEQDVRYKLIESLIDIEYGREWTADDEAWWQVFVSSIKELNTENHIS